MEAHTQKMEAQLKHFGAMLDDLVAKANAREADARAEIDYHKRIDDLKAKYHAAQEKLEELKAASSDKWDTIKTGAESVWNELEVAFKKLSD